jgi:hypothetical protein
MDLASASMPTDIKDALRWCEYIYQNNGTYRMAMERVISYFLTDIELGAVDARDSLGDDEKEKWAGFLADTLNILTVVQNLDRDRSCYGNGFASLQVPFRRMLVCPKCGASFPLEVVAAQAHAETFNFRFTIITGLFELTIFRMTWRASSASRSGHRMKSRFNTICLVARVGTSGEYRKTTSGTLDAATCSR